MLGEAKIDLESTPGNGCRSFDEEGWAEGRQRGRSTRLPGLLILALASWFGGCQGSRTGSTEESNTRQALQNSGGLDIDAILGMEIPSAWSTTTGAVLGRASVHSQGSYSLSVRPSNTNGFTPIKTIPLTALPIVSPTLAMDVMLPAFQPNPNWYGTAQAYIDCPSRNIYSQFLNQVELTGKPLGSWNTINFNLTNTWISGLLQAGYSDLTITVILNVQVPTTGVYYIDNLRFLPVTKNSCGGRPNGTFCTDNSACTTGDSCQSGACHSGISLPCVASDQCHDVGICDPLTGACSNPPKAGSPACDDGNPCTQGDLCQAGFCIGGAPRVCPSDQCNAAGQCDQTTGACPSIPLTGTPCEDGQACSQNDTCQAGVCQAGPQATMVGPTASPQNGGHDIVLEWSDYPGATEYKIKRSITSGGPYATIASTTTPRYVDSAFLCGVANYYVVSAISSCGESPDSAEVSSAPEQHITPTALCVNRISDTTWTAVFGYTNGSSCTITIPPDLRNSLDPSPSDSTEPPSKFLPGVNASVFSAPFPGGSLTWTLGTRSVTVTESLSTCSISDLPPSNGPAMPVGVGDTPDMPSQAAWEGFESDTVGPYRQVDQVQGGPVSVERSVQSDSQDTLEPVVLHTVPQPAAGIFQFVVIKQMMGNDYGDEVETDIDIDILNIDNTSQKHINYNNPDNWGIHSEHSGEWYIEDFVAPERTDVTVRVSINEHDSPGSDDHWVRRIKFDNTTGNVMAVLDDDGEVLQSGPVPGNCIQDGSGDWGICWETPIVTARNSVLCANVRAQYLDSGYGQDFLEPLIPFLSRTIAVPARFSYAKYRVKSNVKSHLVGNVRIPERTVNVSTSGYAPLDRDGCVVQGLSLNPDDLQYDANGSLEIELRFRSEFCRDPSGNNCPTDPNNSNVTVSGTKYVVTDKDKKVREWCVILTTDESLTSNECDVIHASQGAFADWNGSADSPNLKYAPRSVSVRASGQDALSRTAAVVSTIYKRAIDSPEMMGAFFANPEGKSRIYKLPMDTFCTLDNDLGNGKKGVDSCSDGIGPDFKCNPGQPQSECAYWRTSTGEVVYTPCEAGPGHPDCRPGLSHFKTVLAHEIGHQVQGANGAMTDNSYGLSVPGIAKLCTCEHVTNANQLHCPQSVEYWSTAFVEGYGHYFAAGTLNKEPSLFGLSPCIFLYEKEIADETCRAANGTQDCTQTTIDGKSVYLAKVPIKVNCDTPGLWRNRHCGGEGADLVAGTAVELDMLGFLRAVTVAGSAGQRISNALWLALVRDMKNKFAGNDFFDLSWEGSTKAGGAVGEHSLRQEILEAAGGNEQQAQYKWALLNANSYGVSRSTY